MRKTLATFAVVALALAGCGTTGEDEATVSNTSSPSTSKTTSSTTPTSETSTEPTTEADEAEPQFVECQLADGTALMSDGSTTYMDSCNESAGGPMVLEDGSSIYDQGSYQCPQTDAFVSDPSQCTPENLGANLDDIPFADGGTCPAYRCGYGHDENGNPNKSSGEIQTEYGCEQGYITDPALCGAN